MAFVFLFIKIKPSVSPVVFYLLLILFIVFWWMVFKKVKHKLGFLIFVFLFFGVLYTLLQTSSVQTWLVNKIGHSLSEKLNAKLSIQKVDVDFLNRLVLKGVMVEDRNKDTLLYAG